MEIKMDINFFCDNLINKSSGIYRITSPNGMIYIGQSVNLNKRFKTYLYIKSSKGMRKIYNSFLKYGIENHTFCVIKFCDISELDYFETELIKENNTIFNGLNCRSGGKENSSISIEGRVILSEKMKKYWQENKYKRIGINRVFTQDHKNMISETRIKNKISVGGKNPNSKKVLHLETGIFYDCLKYACNSLNLKYSSARSQMQGRCENKTNLIYI